MNDKTYKEMRKKLIHPWEKPMRFINILVFIGSIVISAYALTSGVELINERFTDSGGSFSLFLVIGAVVIALGKNYAQTKATSVKVTEKQFPEVYKIIKLYSEKLELRYIPEAYIVQNGGVINAFATSFFARRYISINSDVFEVSYLEHKDMDTLSFIIAHELAHLKRKHATTLMTIIETPSRLIPIWSSTISRVKEYTCDRHAAWLCPEGIDGIMLLGIGKHLYKEVDIEEYLLTSNKNYRGLFCFVTNLLASHPVMPKRVKALKNLNKRGQVF